MHYYQFNIGDYRRDTQHLTPLEHGIYRLLLDQFYLTECPIDANALRLLCVRSKEDIETAMRLLDEFFTDVGEGEFVHKRASIEIEKYHSKSSKASDSAKKRWSHANAMRTHSEGNANHKPLTTNQEPLTTNHKPRTINQEPKVKTVSADKSASCTIFDQFWQAYPKKTGKGAALKVWVKLKDHRNLIDLILKALAWQSSSEQWTRDGGQYVPNPSTYLNQERWLDEPPRINNDGLSDISRRNKQNLQQWIDNMHTQTLDGEYTHE